jgi:DNA-binding protein Fis
LGRFPVVPPESGGSSVGFAPRTAQTPVGPERAGNASSANAGNPLASAPASEGSAPPWVAEIFNVLPDGVTLLEILSGLEEALVRKAMEKGGNVQSRAADLLGLRRNVFKYKWDKYAGSPASAFSSILEPVVPAGGDLVNLMAVFEEEVLRRALVLASGSQAVAADILGLKRNVMPYKLKKYPALAGFS